MATGGIFQLITNDGKQDRMLMATGLLNMRLKNIERQRSRNPHIRDPTPTLVDIEKTHILFVNAHFKPFAALGYEYNRVSPQSGNAQLGGTVEFSIPQFGDFFNDMALHVVLGNVAAPNAAYWDNPADNNATGQELIRYVDFVGQRLAKFVEFRVNGNPLDNYTSDIYNMHHDFCVQPNKEVGWARNVGQELPEYGYADVAYRATSANPASACGLRQQLAFLDGPQTPKPVQEQLELWIPLLFWFNLDPRLSIPSVSIPYGQRFIDVTLASSGELLQCMSANGVVTPSLLPYYNAPINIERCELYINNIFVNPEIHDIFIKRIGFNLIRVHRYQIQKISKDADQILLNQLKWPIETLYLGLRPSENQNLQNPLYPTSWHLYGKVEEEQVGLNGMGKSLRADVYADPTGRIQSASSTFVAPTTLYTRSSPGVGDVLITTLQQAQANCFADQLDDLWYVLNVAEAPGYAANNYTYNDLANALKTTDLVAIDFVAILQEEFGITVLPNAVANMQYINSVLEYLGYPSVGNSNTAFGILSALGFPQYLSSTFSTANLFREYPVFDSIQIQVHGINLYNQTPASFFNSYMPYTYGGHNIRTPNDNAVHMVNFCLYPGAYQPSGHINVSRAREFYLIYTAALYPAPDASGYVDRANPQAAIIDSVHTADLVVIAIALNFLLISDGSAILRYST
jgi:hypothetical protein